MKLTFTDLYTVNGDATAALQRNENIIYIYIYRVYITAGENLFKFKKSWPTSVKIQ